MLDQLANITVVEMGTFITGPAASMQLADLGAEVLKIERPGTGDPFRAFNGGLYSPHFQTYNRNKKSITLDTRDQAGLEEFDDLISRADVFIQNFRPGTAEKLNVGHDRLMSSNPRLIYCSISGFGSSGPESGRPAFDTVAQAASGFLRLLLNPQNEQVVGPAIADAMTGIYGAMGVLAALHKRERTGQGALVATSMLEAMAYFNLDDFTHYLACDEVMGPLSRPHVSQSYVFECSDGKRIALHMSSPEKFWENLLAAIGEPELYQDRIFKSRTARIKNYEAIRARLQPLFLRQPLVEWLARFSANEVPCSQVAMPEDVLNSAQAKHLGLEVSGPGPHGGDFRTIRWPVTFDGIRMDSVCAPPLLGEHNGSKSGKAQV